MIIAVIPARAGSTRLPGKNMKEILGRPMIDYTIQYAQECRLIDEIYVSTESEEIAEHARKKGVTVVKRPLELCSGVAIVDILRHCVNNIPNSEDITHVVALQVDHPDRELDLNELVKRAIDTDIADMITIGPDGKRNGSMRILRKKDLMESTISYSIIAVQDKCTNIHTQTDFDIALEHLKRIKEIK